MTLELLLSLTAARPVAVEMSLTVPLVASADQTPEERVRKVRRMGEPPIHQQSARPEVAMT
jgi:hypothetical protein